MDEETYQEISELTNLKSALLSMYKYAYNASKKSYPKKTYNNYVSLI